jgi:hypothetical protein
MNALYPEIDWADVDGGYEPAPEDADGQVRTSVAEEEREQVAPEQFWKARPILEHIHDFSPPAGSARGQSSGPPSPGSSQPRRRGYRSPPPSARTPA